MSKGHNVHIPRMGTMSYLEFALSKNNCGKYVLSKISQCNAHAQHRDFDRSTCLVTHELFQLDCVHFFLPSPYDTNTQQ